MLDNTNKFIDIINDIFTDVRDDYFDNNPGFVCHQHPLMKPFWDALTDAEKEALKNELRELRICKQGFYFRAYLIHLDPDTMYLSFTDKHFVTVTIIEMRNRPIARMEFRDDIQRCAIHSREYKRSAAANGTLVLQGSPEHLDDWLKHGEYWEAGSSESKPMDLVGVRYAPDTIRKYYEIGGQLYVNLTKAAIDRMLNRCDGLTRHTPNYDGTENDFGLRFAVWDSTLVEFCCGTYVGEDISPDEIDAFAKFAGENSCLTQEARRRFAAVNADAEAKELRKADIKRRIDAIQDLVNKHPAEVMAPALACLGADMDPDAEWPVEDKKLFLESHDGKFGLDCGYLEFHFSDAELERAAKDAADYGLEGVLYNGSFSLNLPASLQSTTLKRKMGHRICEMAEAAGLDKIWSSTRLD